MRPVTRSTLILLLSAIVVHASVLCFAKVRTGRIDTFAFDSLDAGEYYRLARNLADHATFSQEEAPPLTLDTWRTPGYPMVLAGLMIVIGDSPTAVIVVHQLLAILSVWLLFHLARRWMSDRRALIVALLFLVEPYHLFYSLWLLATTVFVTLLLLTWLVWQRAVDTGRPVWIALLGLLTGFLVLVRPVAALVPAVVLAGLLVVVLRWRRGTVNERPFGPSWTSVPIFAAACALVVGSWMLRNQVQFGYFALSDQSGVVLAYFKGAEVELWRQGRTADRYVETSLNENKRDAPHPTWEKIDEQLRAKMTSLPADINETLRWPNLAQGNKTQADSFAISNALREIGVSTLSASPLSAMVCYFVRCGSILTFPLSLAINPPRDDHASRSARLAKGLPYLLLCVWVVVRLLRHRLALTQVYFPLVIVAALLMTSTPQLDPRFRVPMIPLLLLVALIPSVTSDPLGAEEPCGLGPDDQC